jgi:transcription antitermination factor NusG
VSVISPTAGLDEHRMEGSVLPEADVVQRWYAAYTSANREKRVAEQLSVRAVEHFLPVYASVRRWKDRRVTLALPLFPGYVFVRLAMRERLRVLQVPGVARLVGFNGLPTALPEREIEALKAGLAGGVRAEPHRYLTVGRRVRVKSGPMAGMKGILTRRKNGERFVITVELIRRSVAIEMDGVELEPEWEGKAPTPPPRVFGKECGTA